jgi:hypothetical protein
MAAPTLLAHRRLLRPVLAAHRSQKKRDIAVGWTLTRWATWWRISTLPRCLRAKIV